MRTTVRHFPAALIACIGTTATLIIFFLATPSGLAAQSADTAGKAPDAAQTLRGHQGALLQISVVDPEDKPIERQALDPAAQRFAGYDQLAVDGRQCADSLL